MSAAIPTQRHWRYLFFGSIRIEDGLFKVDQLAQHDRIQLAQILGVERQWQFPPLLDVLIIRHPGGALKVPWVPTRTAKKIVAALGF